MVDWYIYLHLPHRSSKCRYIYHNPYMDPMGDMFLLKKTWFNWRSFYHPHSDIPWWESLLFNNQIGLQIQAADFSSTCFCRCVRVPRCIFLLSVESLPRFNHWTHHSKGTEVGRWPEAKQTYGPTLPFPNSPFGGQDHQFLICSMVLEQIALQRRSGV